MEVQPLKDVRTDRSRAKATLDALDGAQRVDLHTAAEVRDAVEHFGGLVGLLHVSEPKLRSRFYEEAGVLGPTSRTPDRSTSRPTHVSVRCVSEGGLEPPRPCGH